MRKVAVILCSKSKQDYACSVTEMYDCSISFKARRIFMDLCYDDSLPTYYPRRRYVMTNSGNKFPVGYKFTFLN